MAVALWEMIVTAGIAALAPTAEDWRAAAQTVREQHRPGELIVFAPDWIDPLGRQHLGDRMPIEMVARMDAARFGVIWEIAKDDARSPETAGLEPVHTEEHGPLTLRRYEREPAEVVTDFTRHFGKADVSGQQVGRARVVLTEVGFEPHRCIQVVPRPDQSAQVRFTAAELGSELVGYVGLADVFTRRDVRDPGRLTVTIDGKQVAEVTAGVDDGWVRFAAATEPGPAEVEFTATAVGANARDRRVCFAAEARR